MIELDQYRERSLASWERLAENWAREREFLWTNTEPVSRRLVERLGAQPGETVLEIACGTGDTGFLVAREVGPDGRLIATDFSPEMLGRARENARAQGIDNAEFRTLDAEEMDLADDAVDRVVCRFGYMLMADPLSALRETRRVLRDGGRLTFAVWADTGENLWAAVPARELVERGHVDPPQPGDPGIFALADPDHITVLLAQAGFHEHTIEQVPFMWRYVSPAEHWELTLRLAGPLADALQELSEEERETVRSAVASRIGSLLERHGGVPALSHVVTAA